MSEKTEFALRRQVLNEAANLTYYGTALNVVPNTPENEHTRSQYDKCFNEACVEMAKLLKEFGDEQ